MGPTSAEPGPEGSRSSRRLVVLGLVLAAVAAVLAVVNGFERQWWGLTSNVALLASMALMVIALRHQRK